MKSIPFAHRALQVGRMRGLGRLVLWLVGRNGWLSEVRTRTAQLQFFNPDVAVANIMALTLKLQASGNVRDPFAAVVAPINS